MTAGLQGAIKMASPAPAKVLLVEDDPLIAVDLADIVGEIGADVLGPCSDASDAIELLGSCRPDAALIDYSLANGNAGPIADALADAGVPFGVVTGHIPADLTEAGFANVPILQKPYSLDGIRQLLKALLGAAPLRRTA